MALIDRLYSIGAVRKFLWRHWYSFVTRQLRKDDVQFLNYAYQEDPPMPLVLSAADEPNRGSIQLYHHVASQVEWAGKSVLEVSCGHGGGAAYLMRTFKPRELIGLDLNPRGVRHCQKLHRQPGLSFVVGDAGNLPFADHSFDIVLNVEASHCYPSFPGFLEQVKRVLRPGGHLVYTDFRFEEDIAAWERDLAAAPLQLIRQQDISDSVLRGMQLNSLKSIALVKRHLPKKFQKLGMDFAGVEGSRVFNALKNKEMSYRSFCFEAPMADVVATSSASRGNQGSNEARRA